MQVSTFVKEAIEAVSVYSSLEHQPDVSRKFASAALMEEFSESLDRDFFNVFNQPCGYYQLKRFAATCDEASKLSFIEDASEYRLTDDPRLRARR